jgi:hypothetical protein
MSQGVPLRAYAQIALKNNRNCFSLTYASAR